MCVCSQLTLKDLETFLTKTGFAKHYGEHFGEFRELILFRMASLCYCRDDEKGWDDIGDDVEDDAVPIHALERVREYLCSILPFF